MQILGTGIDIIDNLRIKKSLKNKNFINRIFTTNEILLSKKTKDKAAYYAKRFAAKEAFAKALGTGIGKIVSFQDLTIHNNDNGKPYFIPSEKLRLYLVGKNIKHAHLSLSDEKFNAVAFVVLELGVPEALEKGEYNTMF
jgi:holo-[acyl-carrier protein] synthase